MIKPPRSLQGRLLLLVIGVVVCVWLVTVITTWVDARHELDELLDSHLAQAAALLVVQQAQEIDDDHTVDTPTLHRYASKVTFQVFHEGRLALRSSNAPILPMIRIDSDFKTGFATVQIDDSAWRVFAAHGAENDVQVFVGEEIRSRTSILWAVLQSMLWPMALALPLLAVTAWWAVYSGLAPLRRLGRTLAERQPEELRQLAVEGVISEMVPVVDALNNLFERIGRLLESERRFTADAAHELRTPIAAIRAQAQVAMGETDDSSRKHALQNTLDGCDRATRLVEQLLTLSRLEAVEAPAMAMMDLGAVAQQVVGEIAPKAIAKNQTIEFDSTEHCHIQGDETLMTILIRNLVDNAVRYSPPSGQVKVAAKREADRIVLSIEDSGPGVTEDARLRLGERFFRVAGNIESGSGLGWSIVHRIAAAHKLDVQVESSSQLGGLGVRVIAQSVDDTHSGKRTTVETGSRISPVEFDPVKADAARPDK